MAVRSISSAALASVSVPWRRQPLRRGRGGPGHGHERDAELSLAVSWISAAVLESSVNSTSPCHHLDLALSQSLNRLGDERCCMRICSSRRQAPSRRPRGCSRRRRGGAGRSSPGCQRSFHARTPAGPSWSSPPSGPQATRHVEGTEHKAERLADDPVPLLRARRCVTRPPRTGPVPASALVPLFTSSFFRLSTRPMPGHWRPPTTFW